VRRATIVLTNCLDTFKARYEDALAAAWRSRAPIYVISLANATRLATKLRNSASAPRANWSEAEDKLQELARASGGRLYSPKTAFDLSAAYDDKWRTSKCAM
jgi:hypothetical protein